MNSSETKTRTLTLKTTAFTAKGPEDVERSIEITDSMPWMDVSAAAIKAFSDLRLVSGVIFAFLDGVKIARFHDGF